VTFVLRLSMASNAGRALVFAWLFAAIAYGPISALAQQPGSAPGQAVRPVGVVAEIQPGRLILKTDAGPSIEVQVPEGVVVLRVPPGAKDLKAATKVSAGEVAVGDRVFIKGRLSEDQKSVVATSIMVMSKTELSAAREKEQEDWQKRGISGVVKELNPATKELTLAVRNVPPTPANPTRPVVVTMVPGAPLLRYAPDSVKFGDAKPGSLEEIKVGDQVRALGTKSEDGTHFAAEELVSGTFRNIAAAVISSDVAGGTVTVKDLATGKPVLVRTNPDSKLHTLPPFIAMMIARFNSGQPEAGGPGGAARQPTGGSGGPRGGAETEGGTGAANRRTGAGFGGPAGGAPRDFNQMLDHLPPLSLGDLKPGQALIVVSTEGVKPSEVTAIAVLSGVEPILEARPKGSNQVVLGPWNMTMGGGGEEGVQ
jgi:hypothetical protein